MRYEVEARAELASHIHINPASKVPMQMKISKKEDRLYCAQLQPNRKTAATIRESRPQQPDSRLIRWWRPEECERYLHTAECPPAPPKFSSNE
jgi:hypothetical protein